MLIKLKQMRLQDLKTDKINGVIISNPPYGEQRSTTALQRGQQSEPKGLAQGKHPRQGHEAGLGT